MTKDPSVAPDHDHAHLAAPGPVADASVRIARPNDASAVGLVQAAVWRAAFDAVLPQEVLEQFDASRFAHVWRESLKAPPSPRHVLLVGCAGEQVVGFAAVDTLRGKGFNSMSIWLLDHDQDTRAFLTPAGLSPDGAFRDRVVNVDRTLAHEVRLTADLSGE